MATFDYFVVTRILSDALLALDLRCNLLGDAGLKDNFELLKFEIKKSPVSRGLNVLKA